MPVIEFQGRRISCEVGERLRDVLFREQLTPHNGKAQFLNCRGFGDLKSVSDELAPKAEAMRSRLKELGPKPDEKAEPESTDITKERDERDRILKELDESVKLARALAVQADQIMTAIADQRRSIFTNKLFERSESLLAPQLWLDVAGNIGHDLRALGVVSRDTLNRIIESAGRDTY